MKIHKQIYIGGNWIEPNGQQRIDVMNATTEEIIGRVPLGDATDADNAVRAARAAFDDWSRTTPQERAAWLARIAQGLEARALEAAQWVSTEVGTPIAWSQYAQVGAAIGHFAVASQLVANYGFTEIVGNSEVTREAIGVVACITPWNYPLALIAAKVAPALAAGCTVVLKPSEVAPMTAWLLAEVIHEAGLPAGVFNLVPGFGPVVGEALASHPEVDMVSFTGSTAAGRRVGELGARTIKRVALELGGKSAAIVLDDADFTSAVSGAIQACYLNNGQTCFAHTRMLVPADRMGEAKRIAAQVVGGMKVGNPLDEQHHIGPVISAVQQRRVQDYIRKGIEEGAELVVGGADAPIGLSRGYFVQPTVFANVTPHMTIAREEIFGPVLSILAYQDEDDAVRIANDSIYGLGGAVWSSDTARAKSVARRLRTGQVDINGAPFNLLAPFGGYKQSGNGREFGRFGLEEFLEYKSVQLPVA
ncbi:3-succinoylsemialdehyde-pyridine dehydrogenase [Paraburkholderia domus]|uniref:aldehyde dehydrogenase family protein n=1 Tax=Paraburkholderia domus TaxID=2793075 RepID=UPI0019119BC8|nr:aldehyde dehydrogenase family protein [Paraburkholderia domus]MBK5050501.1 aldehyde dehydrogenase family protein [Burkholderia sp. R-70006]CAE6753648.1 3-succinoylsemialdehyde-pyridine dehydrogenase [Paraburkholderia domus]